MNILSITGQCLVLCKAPSRAITSCRHLGMDSTIAHLALHCTATTAKQQNPFSYIPFPDKKFSSDRADFWRNDAILMYLYWEKKSSHLVSPLRRYLTLKRAHVLRRWLYYDQTTLSTVPLNLVLVIDKLLNRSKIAQNGEWAFLLILIIAFLYKTEQHSNDS